MIYNDGHAIVFNGSVAIGGQLAADEVANSQQPAGEGQQSADASRSNNQTTPVASRQTLADYSESILVPFDPMDSRQRTLLVRDLSNSIDLSIGQSNLLHPGTNSAGGGAGIQEVAIEQQLSNPEDEPQARVQLSGAGLAYSYRFETLQLHFGLNNQLGSEHRINSRAFAAELQLFAFNSQLYKTFEEASQRPNGLLAVAILIDVLPELQNSTGPGQGRRSPVARLANQQLERLLERLPSIGHRGRSAVVRNLNLSELLPETSQFVAYEGSLTQPGCHESVIWLVLNRPIYISPANVSPSSRASYPRGEMRIFNGQRAMPH